MPEAEKNEKPVEAKPEPAAKGGGSGGGGGKLVPAMLGLNSLLLAAVLGIVVLRTGGVHGAASAAAAVGPGASAEAKEGGDKGGVEKARKDKEKAKAKDGKEAKPGPTVKLELTAHLRDTDPDRFLRLALEMEVKDEKAQEEFRGHVPAIRDALIAYLADRRADDLRGAEGINQLKSAIQAMVDDRAPEMVQQISITEFLPSS